MGAETVWRGCVVSTALRKEFTRDGPESRISASNLNISNRITVMSCGSHLTKQELLLSVFKKMTSYLENFAHTGKYWLANRDGVCSTEIWVLAAKRPLLITISASAGAWIASSKQRAPPTEIICLVRHWNVVKNYEVIYRRSKNEHCDCRNPERHGRGNRRVGS